MKIQVAGDHDGYPRHPIILPSTHPDHSPGHVVYPGGQIHLGRVCGGTLLFLIGKLRIKHVKVKSIDPAA